jgi:uncharacterized membrane protein
MAMTLFMAFLIGFFAGLRSLTAPAAVAWACWLGWIKLDGRWAAIGSTTAVVVLTLLALAELVADKLPSTPNRTDPLGLIARIVTGGLTGACIALGTGHAAWLGAALGSIGGVTGCFTGYFARTRIRKKLQVPDMYVALAEDLIAIGGSLAIVAM